MRPLPGVFVLLLAACTAAAPPVMEQAPPAPASSGIFLDQGWSSADRAVFTDTAQGSSLMPLPWFLALRRSDADTAFAADRLQRYGYLPARDGGVLPVGFVRDGAAADPQLGMTCAACHTGQLRYKGTVWHIDGGRADADFQAFLTDLGEAARGTLRDPARLSRFAGDVLGPGAPAAAVERLRADLAGWSSRYDSFMAASLPAPAWGPGRLDAFGMIFNRVTGADLDHPANLAKADAPVRYPFIWDAPRQDHTQWTGAAPNGTYLRGLARNTGEVFGVFGHFDPRRDPVLTQRVLYDNGVNFAGLQALEEKVVALRSPRWPEGLLPLDMAKAARGASLFQAECAGCHGARPSPIVQQGWCTPVQNVGTDPRAFDNSQRQGSPRVLKGTRQPPLFGDRLTEPSLKLSILANAVVGSLLRGVVQQDAGIRRAIARDLDEGRLPIVTPAAVAAAQPPAVDVQSATRDLYKTPRDASVGRGATVDRCGAPALASGAAYEARVLTGIWAVGPYLHNGSVPTLWELLRPATERIKSFAIGHREFDPVAVGLETAAAPGRAMFTVDPAAGNGNGGHEYGVALPEEARWALIEYLKTL